MQRKMVCHYFTGTPLRFTNRNNCGRIFSEECLNTGILKLIFLKGAPKLFHSFSLNRNNFSMTQKSLGRIHESSDILQHWIEEISQRNSNVSSSDADPSPCSKVLNIGSIITRKLSNTLSNMKINHNGHPVFSNNQQ